MRHFGQTWIVTKRNDEIFWWFRISPCR
jgi:hypothetical protein